MTELDQDRTLSLLISSYPEYAHRTRIVFDNNSVFREIANEYHECIEQEKSGRISARALEVYRETREELEEELMGYLMGLKSDNPVNKANGGIEMSQE